MKKVVAVLILIFSMMVTGCYSSREIDETGYIIAIGIDDAENNEYKYTFQFAAPLAISGEGGGGGSEKGNEGEEKDEGGILDSGNSGVKNMVVRAADFYVAKNILNNFLSKNIDMSHLKLIVFSVDVDSDGLVKHSQLFRKEREVRPHTALAVSEGEAEEFLRCVNPELEVNTAKYYELMSLRSNNIYAPSKKLYEFSDELESTGNSVLPLGCVSEAKNSGELKQSGVDSEKGGWVHSDGEWISSSKSEMRGMTVFKDNEIKGVMDGDSALIYNILRRDIKECTISIKSGFDDNEILTFRVQIPSKAQYIVENIGNKYKVTIKQSLKPEYMGEELPQGYKDNNDLIEHFCNVVTGEIEDFMYKTSREFGADIMNVGGTFKRGMLTWQDWKDTQWDNKYKNAIFKTCLEIYKH